MINAVIDENYELAEVFKDNFIDYSSVLEKGRFKLTDYLNAVTFLTYRSLGKSMADSWLRTFPDRAERIRTKYKDEGRKDEPDFSSYASMFNKNTLVVLLSQQTAVPLRILNQGLAQRALNKLAHVMEHTKSDKVRVDACKVILDTLKMPEDNVLNIDVNLKADNIIESMQNTIAQLTHNQQNAVAMGKMTTLELLESDIIEGEVL